MSEANAIRTLIRGCSLYINELLIANIKLTLHKEKNYFSNILSFPRLGQTFTSQNCNYTKQDFSHFWKFSKFYTDPPFAHGLQPSVCIRLYNRIVRQQAKVIHNHLSEIFAAQDKGKTDIAAVKLTRVEVTKLQL
jgi:16S rRNA G966 N2-methylase RsmD